MVRKFTYKDPDEVKVFSFYWGKYLNAGATVQGTNTWSIAPSGPTISGQTIVVGGQYTSALISGGTIPSGATKQDYVVTNRVTTSDGETLEESGRLRVRQSDVVPS
jgi:hypothetical protein